MDIIGKKNKKILFDWLSDNGIEKFESFSKLHHGLIAVPVFSLGMLIFFNLDSYIMQMLVLLVFCIISAMPEVMTHRRLAEKARETVVTYVENGGKEPDVILIPDNRFEVWKIKDMRESHKKNRW